MMMNKNGLNLKRTGFSRKNLENMFLHYRMQLHFQERMEKMRSEREAYLEHFNNANGSLGSYQSIELSQTVSFFDENA